MFEKFLSKKESIIRMSWIIAFVIFVIICFELLLRITNYPEYLIPWPSHVFMLLVNNISFFSTHASYTLFEAILGFTLGNVFAFTFACALTLFPYFKKEGMAFGVMLKIIPIVTLAPLFIIWFGNGILGKIILSALVCFFPVFISTSHGIENVPRGIEIYAKSLNLSRLEYLLRIRIMSALPFIITGLKTSSPIALTGAIVAELSGADRGAGYILQKSIYQIDTETMFATIIMLSICGMIFYFFVVWIGNRVLKRFRFEY